MSKRSSEDDSDGVSFTLSPSTSTPARVVKKRRASDERRLDLSPTHSLGQSNINLSQYNTMEGTINPSLLSMANNYAPLAEDSSLSNLYPSPYDVDPWHETTASSARFQEQGNHADLPVPQQTTPFEQNILEHPFEEAPNGCAAMKTEDTTMWTDGRLFQHINFTPQASGAATGPQLDEAPKAEESTFFNPYLISAQSPGMFNDRHFEPWGAEHSNLPPIAPNFCTTTSKTHGLVPETVDGASSDRHDSTSLNSREGLAKAYTTPPNRRERIHRTQPDAPSVPVFRRDPALSCANAVREYLAFPDPSDTTHVTFANDDWQFVKLHRWDEYVERFFKALYHQYAEDGPDCFHLKEARKKGYTDQQDHAMAEALSVMQTPVQLKQAQARCWTLVEAGITVHERGLPSWVYKEHQSAVQARRRPNVKYALDFDSVCSVRLDKMEEAVKCNKLIALDVIGGKNFERFAQDPDGYLRRKMTFLASNDSRRRRLDSGNKADKRDAKVSRGVKRPQRSGRMPKLTSPEEDDEEANQSDVDAGADPDSDYEQPRKCARTRRA